MDQVTKVRKCLNREEWKFLIKECRCSGMTVTAWCKLNGICEQTYYRNLKKLREELCKNLPVAATAPEKPAAFKKLEVMSPLPDTKVAVIIHLPNVTLEVNEGASQQTVQAVLFVRQSGISSRDILCGSCPHPASGIRLDIL